MVSREYMLNYDQFQRAVLFLKAQGIEPTLDMLRLEPFELRTLLSLADEYEKVLAAHKQPELSEAELEEEKRLEAVENLFHSC